MDPSLASPEPRLGPAAPLRARPRPVALVPLHRSHPLDAVAAVVVNWNGGEGVVRCVRSLVAEGLAAERVVVVDNGSRDGSLDRLRGCWPELETIPNAENVGFGHAANQGIERALALGAEQVLLVNDDLVLEPGALGILRDTLEADPRLGIVGPLLLREGRPEEVWAAGGRITHRQNVVTLRGHGRRDRPRWRRSVRVDFVPACAMLARREVLEADLFDGSLFAYFEDVELCLSARHDGWDVACIGGATARHVGGSSTGGGYSPARKYMMALNSVRFLRRHGSRSAWTRFLLFDVLSLPAVLAVGVLRGRHRAVLAKARGLRDGWRGRRVTAACLATDDGEPRCD